VNGNSTIHRSLIIIHCPTAQRGYVDLVLLSSRIEFYPDQSVGIEKFDGSSADFDLPDTIDELGVAVATHDGENIQRKILNHADSALSFIEIGEGKFASVSGSEALQGVQEVGDVFGRALDQNIDVVGCPDKAVQCDGDSADYNEFNLGAGEVCQQLFVRGNHRSPRGPIRGSSQTR